MNYDKFVIRFISFEIVLIVVESPFKAVHFFGRYTAIFCHFKASVEYIKIVCLFADVSEKCKIICKIILIFAKIRNILNAVYNCIRNCILIVMCKTRFRLLLCDPINTNTFFQLISPKDCIRTAHPHLKGFLHNR